jgi:hypothetical protein
MIRRRVVIEEDFEAISGWYGDGRTETIFAGMEVMGG